MQEANEKDAEDTNDIRSRERNRVVWVRTQAFAALLLFVVFWTMTVCVYRASTQRTDTELPKELIVDLNDATQAELNLLPGVGEKLANDILKYRDEIGGFQSVDELMNIRGIKEGRLRSLKKYVTVSGKRKFNPER